jgi:hypothetical protein
MTQAALARLAHDDARRAFLIDLATQRAIARRQSQAVR